MAALILDRPVLLSPLVPNIQTSSSTLNKDKTVVRKGEERNLGSSNTSSKKENREEVEKEEREEAKRRILEENPHISKDALEFMLSLPVELKIPKVTEMETIHATAEQQQEMDRLSKENNKE
jgi:hypothetical protein